MAISISINLSALRTIRQLDSASAEGLRASERLASGLRVNRPSDDAAALAISLGLTTRGHVYGQAIRNANDAISLINVADGATEELGGILMQLKELATQAANGSLSSTQRLSLHTAGLALSEEYNRIVGGTAFNGMNILSANSSGLRTQLGFGTDGSIGFVIGDGLERRRGTGTYTYSQASLDGSTRVLSLDADGDGTEEIVSINGTKIHMYKQGSGGNLSAAGAIISHGTSISDFAVGNFDGSGGFDIAVIDTAGTVQIYRNTGSGTFASYGSVSVGALFSGAGLAAGDIDGDGDDDLAATGTGAAGGLNSIRNNGGGSLTSNSIASASTFTTVGMSDLNGDGKADIVARINGSTSVRSYLSTGTSFTLAQTLTITGATHTKGGFVFGDFNGDGYNDIAMATGRLEVAFGNNNGTFGSVSVKGSATIIGIDVGDINGDGTLDLVGNSSFGRYTWINDDYGEFGTEAYVFVATAMQYSRLVDLDGDGIKEFILGGSTRIESNIAEVTYDSLLPTINMRTVTQARQSLTFLDAMLERVLKERGANGSTLSRLSSALATLQSSTENLETANSRLKSADVADETARLLRSKILSESATAILAQANQQPSLALILLGS